MAASPVFGELLQGTRDDTERNLILGYWKALSRYSEESSYWQSDSKPRASSRERMGINSMTLPRGIIVNCCPACKFIVSRIAIGNGHAVGVGKLGLQHFFLVCFAVAT